jgi:hypothetical protein
MPPQQHQKRLVRFGVQSSTDELTRRILPLDSEENEQQVIRELGDQTVSGAIPAMHIAATHNARGQGLRNARSSPQ